MQGVSPESELGELTEKSLSWFTHRLIRTPDDPLIAELRGSYFIWKEPHQRLFLKYLIGSVAVFGGVDEDALAVISRLCDARYVVYLTPLVKDLARKNDIDTVANFIAQNLSPEYIKGGIAGLVVELSVGSWDAVKTFVVRVLGCLKRGTSQGHMCYFMLRRLPIERQYEIINDAETSVFLADAISSTCKFDPLLREMLASKPSRHDPEQQVSNRGAGQRCPSNQSPDNGPEGAVLSRHGSAPAPSADVLHYIFQLLDIGTLFVLPFVCKFWKKLHSEILTNDPRIHSFYLEELAANGLMAIYRIAPWKYCLQSLVTARKYFGLCILTGAFGKFNAARRWNLLFEMDLYLNDVTRDENLLPRIRGRASLYDSFQELFGAIYGLYASPRTALLKPNFLTAKEYERAVHHFVYEKRRVLKLSETWIRSNIVELFNIIQRDEDLMAKLIDMNLSTFERASRMLILNGQKGHVPEELVRMVFSRTKFFRRLIEPTFVRSGEWYSFIVGSGMLFDFIEETNWTMEFDDLMISLVLSFRNSPDVIDRGIAAIADRYLGHDSPEQRYIRWAFDSKSLDMYVKLGKYATEDIEFFKRIMLKWGLMQQCKR